MHLTWISKLALREDTPEEHRLIAQLAQIPRRPIFKQKKGSVRPLSAHSRKKPRPAALGTATEATAENGVPDAPRSHGVLRLLTFQCAPHADFYSRKEKPIILMGFSLLYENNAGFAVIRQK